MKTINEVVKKMNKKEMIEYVKNYFESVDEMVKTTLVMIDSCSSFEKKEQMNFLKRYYLLKGILQEKDLWNESYNKQFENALESKLNDKELLKIK